MPSCRLRPTQTAHRVTRRRATGIAGFAFAGLSLMLAVPGQAQAATASAADLVAPGSRTHTMIEFDPFRAFTNCLAEAAHGDSMYPGIDPSEVNACLGL